MIYIRYNSKDEQRRMEGKGQMLTSRDFNSLAIDSPCVQARGQSVSVVCFYLGHHERSGHVITYSEFLVSAIVGYCLDGV